MIKKIEHIGIAVKDLNNSNSLFQKLFGRDHYKIEKVESEGVATSFFMLGDTKIEKVESEGVATSFFMLGDTKIELLQATNEDSAISKFISKKGEGVHHIAYEVDDIEQEINRLKEEGFEVINKEPKDGADNKRI